MRIYIIRHGQTDWNLQGRFQGREDIPLNEFGIQQAHRCGKALKKESFRAVITSPLQRAKKTAEIIAGHVGVNEVIIEEGIIERDFRKISGLTPKEREMFYATGGQDDKEPWDKLCGRMMAALKKYAKLYYGENIIMVSHGASINATLTVLSKGEIGSRKTRLKNACISIIEVNHDELKLGPYNLEAEEYLDLELE